MSDAVAKSSGGSPRHTKLMAALVGSNFLGRLRSLPPIKFVLQYNFQNNAIDIQIQIEVDLFDSIYNL